MTETNHHASPFDARERELREKCESRLAGCGLALKRLRETGNPDDLADAAFLLGTLSDFSDYVALLRGMEPVREAAARFVGMGIAIQDEGFFERFRNLCDALQECDEANDWREAEVA